jgi:glycine reductase
MLGVNRVVVGEAVPHPVGNPKLAAEKEKELRRAYVLKALELLQQDVEEPRIVTL